MFSIRVWLIFIVSNGLSHQDDDVNYQMEAKRNDKYSHVSCDNKRDNAYCDKLMKSKDYICQPGSFMYDSCKKTCKMCHVEKPGPDICQDRDSKRLCARLAKKGECKETGKFRKFTEKYCQFTCHFCSTKQCEDSNVILKGSAGCKYWKNSGFCEKDQVFYKYMQNNCKKTCQSC